MSSVVPPSGGPSAVRATSCYSDVPCTANDPPEGGTTNSLNACREVAERARTNLREHANLSLLSTAMDHLTLARAALYEAILAHSSLDTCHSSLSNAVEGLRRSGNMDELPRGLLTRAWQRHLSGQASDAAADLDEAWEIAERGPMPLYQADVLLTRARLFGLPTADCRLRVPHTRGAHHKMT